VSKIIISSQSGRVFLCDLVATLSSLVISDVCGSKCRLPFFA